MDPPVCFCKEYLDQFVSGLVASDLRFPVVLSRFRHAAVPRATVPEATVYKQRDTLTMEYEIRLPGEWLMSSPAGNAV